MSHNPDGTRTSIPADDIAARQPIHCPKCRQLHTHHTGDKLYVGYHTFTTETKLQCIRCGGWIVWKPGPRLTPPTIASDSPTTS